MPVYHHGVCPICGSEFHSINPRQKFCCRRCLIKDFNSRHSRRTRLKCATCGGQLTEPRSWYCSKKCKPRKVVIQKTVFKKCQKCGRGFHGLRQTKLCSQECRHPRKVKPAPTHMTSLPQKCHRCEAMLPIPRQKTKIYCSRRCKERDSKFVGLISTVGVCVVCSGPLKIPRQPKAKYCSEGCSKKAMRKNNDSRPERRLRSILSKSLRDAIRKRHANSRKNKSILTYTGCALHEVMAHLESQFQPGMSWNNHSTFGWHIDHIIPLAKFDLSKEDHRHVALHYTNLRPLWWKGNVLKSDTVIHDIIPDGVYLDAIMIGVL